MCYLLSNKTLSLLKEKHHALIQGLLEEGGTVAVLERGRPSHLLCLRGMLPEGALETRSAHYLRINDAYVKSVCWRAVRPLELDGSSGDPILETDLASCANRYSGSGYTYLHDDLISVSEFAVPLVIETTAVGGDAKVVIGVLDARSPRSDSFTKGLQRALEELAETLIPLMLADQDQRHQKYTYLLKEVMKDLTEAMVYSEVEDCLPRIIGPASRMNMFAAESIKPPLKDCSFALYMPAEQDKWGTDWLVPDKGVQHRRNSKPIEKMKVEDLKEYHASSIAAAQHGMPLFFWDMRTVSPRVMPRREVELKLSNSSGAKRKRARRRFVVQFYKLNRKAKSALVVPIKGRRIYGVLILEHRMPFAYHWIEADALGVLAATLAVAFDASAKTEQIRRYSSGLAGATVMARNIAHHIGSHVLAFATSDLNSMAQWDPEDRRYSVRSVYDLLVHLRDRVLFAAIQPTASFSSYVDKALIEPLRLIYDPDGLLVTNLVRSKLGLRDVNSLDDYWRASVDFREDQPKALASIPHGDLGVQALCAIIENLLRNSSNYADQTKVNSIRSGIDTLNLTVEVRSTWTSPGQSSRSIGTNNWESQFLEIRIAETYRKTVPVDVRSLGLDLPLEDYLTSQRGSSANLGILEIKLCAAFLRGIRADEVDARHIEYADYKGQEPPLVYVWNNDDGQLEYRIYLKKPRRVLFVTPSAVDVPKSRAAGLAARGCTLISPAELGRYIAGRPTVGEGTLIFDGSLEQLDEELVGCGGIEFSCWFLPHRILVADSEAFRTPAELRGRVFAVPRETMNLLVGQLSLNNGAATAALAIDARAYRAFVAGRLKSAKRPVELVIRWSRLSPVASELIAHRDTSTFGIPELPVSWLDEADSIHAEQSLVFDHSRVDGENESTFEGAYFFESLVDGNDARRIATEAYGLEEELIARYECRPVDEHAWMSDVELIQFQRLISELYESAISRIAIIDDRLDSVKTGVTRNGKFASALGVSIERTWLKRGVCLASEQEMIKDFSQLIDPIQIVSRAIPFEFVDVLSVHQQMLKTLRSAAQGESESEARSRLRGLIAALKDKCGLLVVHTSTGELNSEVVSDLGLAFVPWLSYNELADRLVADSKSELNSLMFALRGVRRESSKRESAE